MEGALFGWCSRLGMNTFRILAPTRPDDAGKSIRHIATSRRSWAAASAGTPTPGLVLRLSLRVAPKVGLPGRMVVDRMVRGACRGARTSGVTLGELAVLSSPGPTQTVQHHHVMPDSLTWLAGWPEHQVDAVPGCTRPHFADVPSPR